MLSAIVLSLLGVDEPTVVADYALSGEAMVRLRAKLIVKYPDSRTVIENINEVFSAEPAQMEALLDHLRERYGSISSYVEALGAEPEPDCATRPSRPVPTRDPYASASSSASCSVFTRSGPAPNAST